MQKIYDHLILTGSISIDRIMSFGGKYKELIHPDKLDVLSVSILVDKLTNSRGGVAANIAYNFALLGDSPIVLGSIGHDAQDYLHDLETQGVNTKYIHKSDLPTATFTVLTDSDDNQVGGFYSGAMSDISQLTLEPWYDQNVLVVISAGDPLGMHQLVQECITHNLDYAYDVGQQATNITLEQLRLGLEHAKILFGNEYELSVIASRSGYSETQLDSMIPLIVTTLGVLGTKITGSSLKEPILIPAIKDITVLDPTGAGDSYRAGFLYTYLRGLSLQTCAQLGSTVASFAIASRGTQNHTFTFAEIAERLYSAYGTRLPK